MQKCVSHETETVLKVKSIRAHFKFLDIINYGVLFHVACMPMCKNTILAFKIMSLYVLLQFECGLQAEEKFSKWI